MNEQKFVLSIEKNIEITPDGKQTVTKTTEIKRLSPDGTVTECRTITLSAVKKKRRHDYFRKHRKEAA